MVSLFVCIIWCCQTGKRAIDYARGQGHRRTIALLEALSDASPVDLTVLHLQTV